MDRKVVLVALAALGIAGCSTASQLHGRAELPTLDGMECSAVDSGPRAMVIEGFGGKGDPQLIVTERQPASRCVEASPQSRTATLAPHP
jgi:hypothetical protein